MCAFKHKNYARPASLGNINQTPHKVKMIKRICKLIIEFE